jgi:anti-sigma-K factor RskA
MKAGVQPRATVKARLFAAIDAQKSETKIVELHEPDSTLSFWRMAAAASIAVALITSYLAFNYWNKWKDTESNLK